MTRTALLVAAGFFSLSCADGAPGTGTAALEGDDSGPPVHFVSPATGFSSDGQLEVVVWVANGFYKNSILDPKNPHGQGDVLLVANVDGCAAPIEASIIDAGSVSPPNATNSPGGWYWTVTVDLSSCQCSGGGRVRTHHCDGCGNTFDTCEDSTSDCAARDVSLVVQAYNSPDNNKCTTTDFDGDGTTDCDGLTGSLAPAGGGGGESELWVPEPFWTVGDDGSHTCQARSHGNCPANNGDQGGHSCDG